MSGHRIALQVRAAKALAPGSLLGLSATFALAALDADSFPGVLPLTFNAAVLGLAAWLGLAFVLVPFSFLPERWWPSRQAQLDRGGVLALLAQGAFALALVWPVMRLAIGHVPADLAYRESIAFIVAAYGSAGLASALAFAFCARRGRSYPLWTAAVLFIAARLSTRGSVRLVGQGYELWMDVLALVVLSACFMPLGALLARRAKPVLAGLALLMLASIATLVMFASSRPAALAAFSESYQGGAAMLEVLGNLADFDGDGSSGWLGRDCDDANPLVSPLAIEIVGNGVDDNCMGGELRSAPAPVRKLDPRAPKPSVIIVTLDTVRADMLDARHMPQLSRFAASAAVFDNAYAAAPFTSGSMPALFTGHNAMSFRVSWDLELGHEEPLSTMLKHAGYATCAVMHPFWDTRASAWAGLADFTDVQLVQAEQFSDMRAVTSSAVTDRALDALTRLRAGSTPFFLWVHYIDAHAEYVERPGTPFSARSDTLARYEQEVWAIDRDFGRLLAELERSRFFDDGVMVVHSDHGELLDDRGRTGHALWLDESVLRTLLLLRAPGAPVGHCSPRVRLIDVFPTVLDYAGISSPTLAASLAPVLSGEETSDRDVVVYSFYARSRQAATLSGRYKLREDHMRGTSFLFDLHDDPGETRNLIEQKPEVARKLRELLGKTWDLEINDRVIRRRGLERQREACRNGIGPACEALSAREAGEVP